MAYALGAVKPWVKDAANFVGPKFGITLIWGWAPGKFDHPKGLALDFMISNLTNGKAIGDQLSAYVVANAAALNVTYVIWYHQIIYPADGRGWHAYVGDSPHTDHVHVSFKAVPTSSGLPSGAASDVVVTPVSNPLTDTQHKVEQMWAVGSKLDEIFKWINDRGNQHRIGIFLLGMAFIFFGIFKFDSVAAPVMNAATKAVKGAASGK